jgi:hypothetical protein
MRRFSNLKKCKFCNSDDTYIFLSDESDGFYCNCCNKMFDTLSLSESRQLKRKGYTVNIHMYSPFDKKSDLTK